MKHWYILPKTHSDVAPHTGAWIETAHFPPPLISIIVAPHTGAWIETMLNTGDLADLLTSHPTRVRGLKPTVALNKIPSFCRTPHGCVD